jgi:hypothetical protein
MIRKTITHKLKGLKTIAQTINIGAIHAIWHAP